MELFAADGHDAGGCERVTGKSGMRPRQEHRRPAAGKSSQLSRPSPRATSAARTFMIVGSVANRRRQSARTSGPTPSANAAASSRTCRTAHSWAWRIGSNGIRQVSCQAFANAADPDVSGFGPGTEVTCSTEREDLKGVVVLARGRMAKRQSAAQVPLRGGDKLGLAKRTPSRIMRASTPRGRATAVRARQAGGKPWHERYSSPFSC